MKILLSAYACKPNKGSEQGVGWNWAMTLNNNGHEVWLLTDARNKDSIETYLEKKPIDRLHVIFFELPKRYDILDAGFFLFQIKNMFWQYHAYKHIQKNFDYNTFDAVHHVTYASFRLPSFLHKLPVPFYFGPVGGGEKVPSQLRSRFSTKEKIGERLRDFSNSLAFLNPLLRKCYQKADKIFLANPETLRYLHKKEIPKAKLLSNAGVKDFAEATANHYQDEDKHLRIIFAGRLIHWKGADLAIEAFSRLVENQSASLTLIGKGPYKPTLKAMSKNHGSYDKIHWIDWVDQAQLFREFNQHDVFLFPSLRDSGGMVVIEALMQGLPVVCLDLGGPGVIVDETCGFSIPAENKTREEIIDSLHAALLKLYEKGMLETLSKGARKRSKTFTWQYKYDYVYGPMS